MVRIYVHVVCYFPLSSIVDGEWERTGTWWWSNYNNTTSLIPVEINKTTAPSINKAKSQQWQQILSTLLLHISKREAKSRHRPLTTTKIHSFQAKVILCFESRALTAVNYKTVKNKRVILLFHKYAHTMVHTSFIHMGHFLGNIERFKSNKSNIFRS